MDIIVVDFTGVKNTGKIHQKLKGTLEFPNYYGNNWDVLLDMLTGYINYYTIIIKLKGLNSLPFELKSSIDMLIKLFKRANKEDHEFKFIIEDKAKQKQADRQSACF